MAKFLFKMFRKLGRTAGVGRKVTGDKYCLCIFLILDITLGQTPHLFAIFQFLTAKSKALKPSFASEVLLFSKSFLFHGTSLRVIWEAPASPYIWFSTHLVLCSVSQSCPTLCNPMDCIAYQIPLSMGFSRQDYRSRLPFPPPGDLPNPGIKPRSPGLQADFYHLVPPGKSHTFGRWLEIEGKM